MIVKGYNFFLERDTARAITPLGLPGVVLTYYAAQEQDVARAVTAGIWVPAPYFSPEWRYT